MDVTTELLKEYHEELKAAAETFDVNAFKAFMRKWKTRGVVPECFEAADNNIIEIALRKMVIEMSDTNEGKKREAREWLKARGYREGCF